MKIAKINQGVWFVLPAVMLLVLIIVFPIFHSIYLSLWESFAGKTVFVGLGNFVDALTDKTFWSATRVTFIFSVASVVIDFLLGLLAALLLHQKIRGRRAFRTIMLVPWMVASPIVAVLWQWVYDAQFGIGNAILKSLHLISTYQPWLGDLRLALPSVILANVWKNFPFVCLILLAGMQAIPDEQYEAATVDGASGIQKFFYVTIPLSLIHI